MGLVMDWRSMVVVGVEVMMRGEDEGEDEDEDGWMDGWMDGCGLIAMDGLR